MKYLEIRVCVVGSASLKDFRGVGDFNDFKDLGGIMDPVRCKRIGSSPNYRYNRGWRKRYQSIDGPISFWEIMIPCKYASGLGILSLFRRF